MRASPKPADLYPVEDYWKARGNRAMAAFLLHACALLIVRRETLRLRRQTLQIQANHFRQSDTKGLHLFGARAADYYRDHGRLLQMAKRLGERIDRRSPAAAKPASQVVTFS